LVPKIRGGVKLPRNGSRAVSQQVSERIKRRAVRTCHRSHGMMRAHVHACMCERGEAAHVAVLLDNAMPSHDVFSREMQAVAGHARWGKAPWEREKGGEEMDVPRRCTTGQNNCCCFQCGGSGETALAVAGLCGCFGSSDQGLLPYGATVYLLSEGCSIRAPYPVAVSSLPRWAACSPDGDTCME
jgi:hypothetical protein